MPDNKSMKRIAILGGGLTGLAAAHRLQELAKEQSQAIEVTVFEAGPRLGGLVGTRQVGDYLVDTGADSFLTNKPAAIGLCRRLGIEHRLIQTDTRFRGAMVLFDGRPIPIPEGFQLLSPTAIWPIVTTPLFSVWGKIRLLMEWFVPRRNQPNDRSYHEAGHLPVTSNPAIIDESLSAFVTRRFGREALERLVQPLVGGIYTSDPERLSLAATMPRFLEMERVHGSLIRAALRQKGAKARPPTNSVHSDEGTSQDTSSGARYGLFAGLKGGMQDLIEALRTKVEATCSIRFNSKILAIREATGKAPESSSGLSSPEYNLEFADGTEERFSAVIIAVSATATAGIINPLDGELSSELSQIDYASSAIVVSGHRLADIQNPLNAFGLVIPHAERRRILAVSFSSRKFPDRAPADRVLLRTFVGGALQPEMLKCSDDELLKIVREELSDTLGVRGEPDFMQVFRYQQAMPQYHVGHLDRVARIEELTRNHPGVAIAGIACYGVGIPDAIASGERAAQEIVNRVVL